MGFQLLEQDFRTLDPPQTLGTPQKSPGIGTDGGPQKPGDALSGSRHVRLDENRQIPHQKGESSDNPGRGGGILGSGAPGLGGLEGLVSQIREGENISKGAPQLRTLQLRRNPALQLRRPGRQRRIGFTLGNTGLVESEDKRENPVHEIREVPDKLAVHRFLKIGPAELIIGGFRAVVEDVEAPHIRGNPRIPAVAAEHADALALGELAVFVVEILG